jgi:hypothetical protein
VLLGVPHQKVSAVAALIPGAHVRVASSRDSERTLLRVVVPADLCIVIPKHMGHKQTSIARSVFGRAIVNAASFNDAIRIANQFVANARAMDESGNSWLTPRDTDNDNNRND